MALALREKYNQLNDAFKQIHIQIWHSRAVPAEKIPNIQACITKYMAMSRKHFRDKALPKQHILEAYCVPWIKKYGLGLAFHSEQGGELIHASVAKLERRGAAIRNIEKQLKTILKFQYLQTSSELLANAPSIKNCKRNTKFSLLRPINLS